MLRHRNRHRRGGILLELVLTIPFSLILVFLAVDIGRYVLARSALHDAASVAARAGARTGVVGTNPGSTGNVCGSAGTEQTVVYNAFCEAAGDLPGADVRGLRLALTDTQGSRSNSRYCTMSHLYVNVQASAQFEFLVDSLNPLSIFTRGDGGAGDISLERAFSGDPGDLPGVIRVSATARCEVARDP